ncbi:hypothetical protein [Amycolatopsis sp. NPDC049159]|uniref:hypothetical protein n=1 Tax=Amycolatopsis sp. NPDC049159 TaxID=3157210 RepID=UPI0033F51C91
MLIVVEEGDVELVVQPPLDGEAARGGDVFGVDRAERGREVLHRADRVVEFAADRADRPGVDVAEPEQGGAVGDDGDRVGLDRLAPEHRRVAGDPLRLVRDARRVVLGQVRRRVQGDAGRHFHFPRLRVIPPRVPAPRGDQS